MKKINVKMMATTDKTLVCVSGNFVMGFRGDNCTSQVCFSVPADFVQKNAVAVLVAPVSRKQYSVPLTDLSFLVSSTVSAEVGDWQISLLLLGDSTDADMPVCISAPVCGKILDSKIDTTKLETLPVDANMSILYNDLLTLQASLKNTLLTAEPEDVKKIEEAIAEVQKNTAAIAGIDFSGLSKIAALEPETAAAKSAAENAAAASAAAETAVKALAANAANESTLTEVKTSVQSISASVAGVSTAAAVQKVQDTADALAKAVAALPQTVPADYAKEKTLTDLASMTTGYYQTLNNMLNTAVSSANGAKNSADYTEKSVSSLAAFVGTAAKEDNTISNWSYWGMVRADEAKAQAAANASSIAALPQKSDIPAVPSDYAKASDLSGLAKKTDIPAVPSDYATASAVAALPQKSDIPTDYAKKADIPSVSALAMESTAQSILSAIGAAQTAAAEV